MTQIFRPREAQLNWVGGGIAPPQPFKDVRNTRPSVAEEKAQLALELGRLINHVPPKVRDGSINVTREWRAARGQAARVAGSARSSVHELTAAISNMRRWSDD